jgi:hypothetical protein
MLGVGARPPDPRVRPFAHEESLPAFLERERTVGRNLS